MLMKSQFRSCTYCPFSVSFSGFLLPLHWQGRFRNCTGLGWHRFPVSETRAFLRENREDRWHVSDSGSGEYFVRIHVVVDVGLVFHDVGIFVCEKTLNRNYNGLSRHG